VIALEGQTDKSDAEAAAQEGIQLEVVKHGEAKHGLCPCPAVGGSEPVNHQHSARSLCGSYLGVRMLEPWCLKTRKKSQITPMRLHIKRTWHQFRAG